MSAVQQIPLIFRDDIQRTNQINAWNAVTPDKLKIWKDKILLYIAQNPNQTYTEIHSGLQKWGKISWGTVVGRLSDWTKETDKLLIVTGSRDGKAMYILSPEGIKYLEGKTNG